ncbi:MAG: MBL fold metallo-hydrolase [Actinomycetota bacterium]|nr:MBL fold metallo-hydrolase [Actinomycetota bacterium]
MSWTGGTFGPYAQCVLAPNPGHMTLDGTNTWVLRAPGAARSVVVDPGPLIDSHLAAVANAASPVAVVLLTHGHLDHAEGAAAFAERAGCGVRSVDPQWRVGGVGLEHGAVVEVDGLELRVLATPGHTADSVCFVLDGASAVLTGDTVLGRGTSVVAHPDGTLGPYLASLRSLRELCAAERVSQLWPGHGRLLENPAAVLAGYLMHREQRLEQVRAALDAGARNAREVVEIVYADVDRVLWPAAELSVHAQLEYLRGRPSR